MGLLTQYQDEAERLARQDKNLMRGYSHDVRGLKAEAAPHESVVKDYNAQVEGFKNSAVHYNKYNPAEDKVDSVFWQIIGWTGGGRAFQPVKYESMAGNYYNGLLVSGQLPYAPMAKDVVNVAGGAAYVDGWVQPMMGGHIGGHTLTDSPTATLRTSDGTPVASAGNVGDVYNPLSMYATWNDKPYVAPVTQSQIDTAKASDSVLSEIGDRGEAMRGEFDASQGLLSKKADRLESDVSMNQGALAADLQPEAGGSVFDQTKVFQSITDWLKG